MHLLIYAHIDFENCLFIQILGGFLSLNFTKGNKGKSYCLVPIINK